MIAEVVASLQRWLRVAGCRVFYTLGHVRREVQILAIGVKQGNRMEDEEELERLLMAYSPQLRTEAARERLREGAGVRHEELWRELESG